MAGEVECLGDLQRLRRKTYAECPVVRVFACSLIDYAQQCARGSVTSKHLCSCCSNHTKDLHRLETKSGS